MADVGVPLEEEPFIHDGQLAIEGLGPNVGDRYKRRDGRVIASVISVDARRAGWVTVRVYGKPQTLRLDTFERQFERI